MIKSGQLIPTVNLYSNSSDYEYRIYLSPNTVLETGYDKQAIPYSSIHTVFDNPDILYIISEHCPNIIYSSRL